MYKIAPFLFAISRVIKILPFVKNYKYLPHEIPMNTGNTFFTYG